MTLLYLRRSLPWRFVQVPSHYLILLIRLEVLDPKMDQGFGEDVEDEYDVSRPLLPTEVIGIMDQILCLEVCQNYNTKYHAARRLRSDRLAGILASPSHKRCLRPPRVNICEREKPRCQPTCRNVSAGLHDTWCCSSGRPQDTYVVHNSNDFCW